MFLKSNWENLEILQDPLISGLDDDDDDDDDNNNNNNNNNNNK
jgi:hypothetical protein